MNKRSQEQIFQAINRKYNFGRSKIDEEIKHKILNAVEEYNRNGILHSSMFVNEIVNLHKERILRLLKLRKDSYITFVLNNKPITTKEEIDSIMKDLEKIAATQSTIIIGCNNILNEREKELFTKKMNQYISHILSDIKNELNIEKDENLFFSEKSKSIKDKKIKEDNKEINEFQSLLELLKNDRLKSILLRDYHDAQWCLNNNLWKPCVILCGGILEGVFQVEFNMENEPNLESMINKAKQDGILPRESDKNLAHAVRLFRNYVHINKELKENHQIDDTDAIISINVVKKIFRNIHNYLLTKKE